MLPLRQILSLLGVALVLVGLALLFKIVLILHQLLDNPSQVEMLNFITQHIKGDDKAITGTLAGQPIEIIVSESTQKMGYTVISVIIFGILSSIVIAIINAGVGMIQGHKGLIERLTEKSTTTDKNRV